MADRWSTPMSVTLNVVARGLLVGAGTPYRLTRWPNPYTTADIRTDDDPTAHVDGITPGPDLLGGRSLAFEVEVIESTPELAQQRAIELAAAFAPANSTEWLEMTIADRTFAWRGRYRGVADDLSRRFLSGKIPMRCRFLATDPLRYGPEEWASIGLSDVGDGFILPVVLPAIIDGTTGAGETLALNTGSRSVPFSALLTGPLGNPRLTHVESGRFVRVLTTLGAGETAVIDSRPSVSTVLVGGASRPDLMSGGSYPFLLPPGPATLRLTADTGTGTASITWRPGDA